MKESKRELANQLLEKIIGDKKISNDETTTVTLTEEGFSEPIGTFDPITRVAKLTTSLEETSIVIAISNVCFDGDNFCINNTNTSTAISTSPALKDIHISNVNITTNSVGIFVAQYNNDILINNNQICGGFPAIQIDSSRNVDTHNNQLDNCNVAIFYNELCIDGSIKRNKIQNTQTGIFLGSLHRNIKITHNEISILEIATALSTGIILLEQNRSVHIENNTILLKNLTVTAEMILQLSGIYVVSSNTDVTLQGNIVEMTQCTFEYNQVAIVSLNLTCVDIDIPNDSISIKDNTLKISDNAFKIDASATLDFSLANINSTINTSVTMTNNKTFINTNVFDFSDTPNTTIAIQNIFISNECDNHQLFNNDLSLFCNTYEGLFALEQSAATININNIYIGQENTRCQVKANNFCFELPSHLNQHALIVCTQNVNITIACNTFINILKCILFDTKNQNSTIQMNQFTNCSTGVEFNANNLTMCLANNTFKQIENEAISLNELASIVSVLENTFIRCGVGVRFANTQFRANEIVSNRFINNTENLVNVNTDINFVLDNKFASHKTFNKH